MDSRFVGLMAILPVSAQHKIMLDLVKRAFNGPMYNRIYRYERSKMTNKQREIIDRYLELLPDNSSVLDLGCGNALFYDTHLVSKGYSVTGVDICSNQIAAAKLTLPSQEFVLDDFVSYEPYRQFNGIVSFFSLYNIPRREHKKVLRNCYKWLEPDGRMLINVYVEETRAVYYCSNWCDSPLIFSYYSCKKFKEIARKVGFYVSQFIDTDNPEFAWLILSKTPDMPRYI